MEWVVNNYEAILSIITAVIGAVVAVTAFIKALKSETRVTNQMAALKGDVTITRAGVVQAFKDAVVPKELKVSINKQVKQIISEEMDKVLEVVRKSEERRTEMNYWVLRILSWTAASNKLTVEEQSEINELLALIAEEDQIIETL